MPAHCVPWSPPSRRDRLGGHGAEVERGHELAGTPREVGGEVRVIRRDTGRVEDRDADRRRAATPRLAEERAACLPRVVGVDQRQVRLEVVERVVGRELVDLELHQEVRLGRDDRLCLDEALCDVEQLVARARRVVQHVAVRNGVDRATHLETCLGGDPADARLVDVGLELDHELLGQPLDGPVATPDGERRDDREAPSLELSAHGGDLVLEPFVQGLDR